MKFTEDKKRGISIKVEARCRLILLFLFTLVQIATAWSEEAWKDITPSLCNGRDLIPAKVNHITDKGTDLPEGRLKQNHPYLYKLLKNILAENKESPSVSGTPRKVVVLVRGYGLNPGLLNDMNLGYWEKMVDYLEAEDEHFEVWDATASLDGHASVAANALRLKAFIADKVRLAQTQSSEPEQLSILAHSMGGQITRAYLALDGGRPQIPVDCVIMLSPALCGSWLADYAFSLPHIGEHWDSTRDLCIRNALGFNATHRYLPGKSLGTKYYTIAGTWTGKSRLAHYIETYIRDNHPDVAHITDAELIHDGVVTRSSSWGEAGRAEVNYAFSGKGTHSYSVFGFDGRYETADDHLGIKKNEVLYANRIKPLLLRTSQQKTQVASTTTMNEIRLTTGGASPDVPPVFVSTLPGTLTSTTVIMHTVTIDTTSEAQFFLSASTNAVSFVLQTPSGTVINPDSTNSNANVRYEEEEGSSCYSISNPLSGQWTMTVSCANVGTNTIDYTVAVLEKSLLSFTVERNLAFVCTNASVTILGRLVNAGVGVTGATVSGCVYAPDGSTNAVVLLDDGFHGDGAAGDGIYGGQFTCTQKIGMYGINLTAHGTNSGGETFEREGLGQTTFTAFSPIAEFTDTYSDYGVDLAPTNGLIDEFEIEVGIRVKEAGTFTVAGTLVGTNGVEITSATTEVEATEPGEQTVLLRFDAPTLYDSGALGGFDLKDLVLYGTGNNCALLDSRTNACSTAGYDYYQFERADKDGDGLSDLAEEMFGTDPDNSDSDFDGMPDRWEIDHDLDPLTDDAETDSDNDGMTNYEEFMAGTDPQDPKSSLSISYMGGLVQYQASSYLSFVFQSVPGKTYVIQSAEAVTGTWNTVSVPFTAVSNSTQVLVQKLPVRKSSFYRISLTEGPGFLSTYTLGYDLPDQWIQLFNWDALPEPYRSQRNASDDPDGDGMNNQAEMVAGTDPCDPNSVLRMLSFEVQLPTQQVGGQFSSVPDRDYWVETTTNLNQGWKPITGLLRGSELITAWDATNNENTSNAYYRVMVVNPTNSVIWK